MQTSNNLSNYENVRVGFTYINCLKIFEYCEGFYNSLENYDIDFSKIVVPECLELFSEQNPLDNQTNISEQELFIMLIYISFVKICFRQAICKEPSLKNPVSFTKYTKILYGVEKHLEQRLHQSVYIENAVCRLYPLKQYNIFYMPKMIGEAFRRGEEDVELLHCKKIKFTSTLKAMLKYYNISFLEESLFIDKTNKGLKYSIPKASILSLAFLICLHKKDVKVPLHVQYMIISDAVINISVAKGHDLKTILQRILKIRENFLETVKEVMTKDKHFLSSKGLTYEDDDYLASMSALKYYESEKIFSDYNFDYSMDKQYMNIFRKTEKQILNQAKAVSKIPVDQFYKEGSYSKDELQPLPSELVCNPSPESFAYEHYIKNNFVHEYLRSEQNPFCPEYFISFFS